MGEENKKKIDVAGDPILAGALAKLREGHEGEEPLFFESAESNAKTVKNKPQAIISGPVNAAAAHLEPMDLPPVVKHKTMELQRVVVPDPRRANTVRRLDRPPLEAPPEYVEASLAQQTAPAQVDGAFPAAPSLGGPGAMSLGPSPVSEGPSSGRTLGGKTERLVTGGSTPPAPPADAAKIHADFAAEGDHGPARTVGGRTERLQHGPADVAPLGGEPSDEPVESSRWAVDPPAAGELDKGALPSSYASTLGSDSTPGPGAASARAEPPSRGKSGLVIGLVAVVAIGVGAFLWLGGSPGEPSASSGSAPISIPAPSTPAATAAAAVPAPSSAPSSAETAAATPSPSTPVAARPGVPRPSVEAKPAAKTIAPAAPTGPTLPPQIF